MKKRKMSLRTAILTSTIGGILSLGLIVGTAIAYNYQDLLDVFFTKSDYEPPVDSKNLCEDVVEEGAVLLKNEDNALPLKQSERKVALLGQNSVDFVYGGSGSGSVDSSTAATLKSAFEEQGFTVNSKLWDFYVSGPGKNYRKQMPDTAGHGDFAVNEVPQSVYTQDVLDSLNEDDFAIVSIGRGGGESADIPTSPLASGYTYLQIDKEEQDLLKMAFEKFDKVILLVNTNNQMELGFLE